MPLLRLGRRLARLTRRTSRQRSRARFRRQPVAPVPAQPASPTSNGAPKGPVIDYSPDPDGRADPGEVVWAWVPFEEDSSQGKDRPVLVIGCCDGGLVGLGLTSKDHDRDAAQEAGEGRFWMDVGSGGWDKDHRPSEVRLNRLISIDDSTVRREGAALDKPMFDAVVAAARPYFG